MLEGGGLIHALDREGEVLEAALDFGEAGFEAAADGGGGEFGVGVGEQVVDGEADHFGDIAEAAGVAEFTEAVVFLEREAEADHSGARFWGHVEARIETVRALCCLVRKITEGGRPFLANRRDGAARGDETNGNGVTGCETGVSGVWTCYRLFIHSVPSLEGEAVRTADAHL